MPIVSVTIPTYNRAELLKEAIQSVLGQSLEDVEVFVSDNASTDGTAEVVRSFRDPRLHYVRRNVNVGPHANLSEGFRLGTAPYLAILQDDDIMLPDNLGYKVRMLDEHRHVGYVHSSFRRMLVWPDGGSTLTTGMNWVGAQADRVEPSGVVARQLLAGRYWIPYSGMVIQRECARDVRFDSADELADDLGMILRLTRRTEAVGFAAEPLVITRFHPGAHSARQGVVEAESSYAASFDGLSHIRRVKERFLSQFGGEYPDLAQIQRAARRWLQRELLRRVMAKTLPDRPLGSTVRLLRQAGRVDPLIWVRGETARILVGSAVGARGRRIGSATRRYLVTGVRESASRF